MDPRTLRKITRAILSDRKRSGVITRISGHKYLIEYYESGDQVTARLLLGGRDATGSLKLTDPRVTKTTGTYYVSTRIHKLDGEDYINGGEVFKKAVEWCHDIHTELKRMLPGSKQRTADTSPGG